MNCIVCITNEKSSPWILDWHSLFTKCHLASKVSSYGFCGLLFPGGL
jgi:hypothetical protein